MRIPQPPSRGRDNPERASRASRRGGTPRGAARRRRVRTVLIVAAAAVALLVLALQALRMPSVATWLANAALRRVSILSQATLSVGEVHTTGVMHLEARDLRMTQGDTVLAVVQHLDMEPRPWGLIAGRVEWDLIAIDGLQVSAELAARAAGSGEGPALTPAAVLHGAFYGGPPLHIRRLDLRDGSYGVQATEGTGPRVTDVTLEIHDVELDGTLALAVDSLALRYTPSGLEQDAIALDLAATVKAGRIEVGHLHVGGPAGALKGHASLVLDSHDSTQAVEVALQADSLDLADLGLFFPGRELAGRLSLDLALQGPQIHRLSGFIRADITESHVGELSFGPARLTADFADGRAKIETTASWEAAQMEIRGSAQPLGDIPIYDLTLQLDGLPRRLPGVPAWEAFARRDVVVSRVHVKGRGYADATLEVEGTMTSGAARMVLRGSMRVQPDLEWEVPQLAVENLDVARWMGDSIASCINGSFTAQGHGVSADSLHLSVAWDLAACRYGPWEALSSEGSARMEGRRLTAGLRLDTEMGQVTVDSVTALLGNGGSFAIPSVHFRGVDLAGVTHRPVLRSDLSGSLKLEGAASPRPVTTDVPAWRRLDAKGHLSLEPSRVGDRAIDRAKAELRFHEETLDAVVQMATDGGRVHLRAQARPFDALREYRIEELRFTEWDVGAWTRTGITTSLNGSLTGKASIVPATVGAAGENDTMVGGEGSVKSRVSGSATLRFETSQVESLMVAGGEVTAAMSGRELEARGMLRTVAGAMDFGGNASFGEHGPRGNARLVVPFAILATLAGWDTTRSAGQVRVDTHFSGLGRPEERLEIHLDGRGHIGDWTVDSLFARTRVADGALGIDSMEVRSNAFHAIVSGRVVYGDSDAAPASDLRLRVRARDASALRALLKADTLALAEGQIEARLTGPAAARGFTLKTSLGRLVWNDWELLGARAETQGILQRDWHPLRATATAEIERLRGSVMRMDSAEVRGDYESEELHAHVGVVLDDAHQLSMAVAARRDSAGLRVDLLQMEMTAETKNWQLVQPAQLYVGKQRLQLDSLEVRSDSAFVVAKGILDRRGEQGFRVEANHVGLDIFTGWLERRDLGGTLDGELLISGPAAVPRVEGAVRIKARSAGTPLGVAEAHLEWDGREAQVHAFFASPARDSVTISGSVPLAYSFAERETVGTSVPSSAAQGAVQLRVEAHRFPLASLAPFLPPEAVSNLQGTFDADIRLSGRADELRGDGRIGITDARIELPSLGVIYEGIQLEGALSGNRLTLRPGRVRSGKGELKWSGDLRLSKLTRVEPNLTLQFGDFLFANTPDLRIAASGELRLTGSLRSPVADGQLTTSGCTFFITQAALEGAGSDSDVLLTPDDIRMMEDTFGIQEKTTGPPLQGLYDAADLDLRVSLGRDNWVRKRHQPRLAMELTGEVHVRKPAHGELELRGHIAPVPGRGYIEQFGRTFDFTGGEVLLNGSMQDHTIDIRTEYKVRTPGTSEEPEVVVHLDVQSDADELRLVLSSEPPLSETEIISYITTGRTPTKPGEGTNAAALAADIGLSQVTGALEDVVQEKVGLDVLQVRYDAIQGATLVAGRYLNKDVYVGVRQPLQYRDKGLNSSQNPFQTAVEVEYEAFRWLVVNLQGEASLVRSFIRASHAY